MQICAWQRKIDAGHGLADALKPLRSRSTWGHAAPTTATIITAKTTTTITVTAAVAIAVAAAAEAVAERERDRDALQPF